MNSDPPHRSAEGQPASAKSVPFFRAAIGGVLMGLANLVPGVSGGTMILVMGLYDDFIGGVADLTRFRFTRRGLLLLGTIGIAAAAAIGLFAGTLSRAVTLHTSAMFSLFIGLTLGGAPLLFKMIGRLSPASIVGMLVGLSAMAAVTFTRSQPPDKAAVREAVAAGRFVIEPHYGTDVAAGAVAISAMVLPGISGAYMLLVLGRYETVLAAIDIAKRLALSGGKDGDLTLALQVIVPVGIGTIVGLVAFSNGLRWMLQRHPKPTLGVLQGILIGSVVGLWPFEAASTGKDYVICSGLAVAGFAVTLLLSRIKH